MNECEVILDSIVGEPYFLDKDGYHCWAIKVMVLDCSPRAFEKVYMFFNIDQIQSLKVGHEIPGMFFDKDIF